MAMHQLWVCAHDLLGSFTFLLRSIKYSSAKRGEGKAQRGHPLLPLTLKHCTWARKWHDILSAVNQINWILIIKKRAESLEDHKDARTLHTGRGTFRLCLHYDWSAASAPISETYPQRQFQNWTSAARSASNHPPLLGGNRQFPPLLNFETWIVIKLCGRNSEWGGGENV